jgi:hypothetical protein
VLLLCDAAGILSTHTQHAYSAHYSPLFLQVPEHSMITEVNIKADPSGPHPLRNITNSFGFVTASVLLTTVLLARSSRMFDARFAGTDRRSNGCNIALDRSVG